jgi:tetratricopeptide (TPR) repeat protein
VTITDTRIPLSLATAFGRMNLPAASAADASAMATAAVPGRLLHDYRPICRSLEWRLAQLHWDRTGLLPFVESDVPFLVNNSGRLSEDVALLFMAHCDETAPAADVLTVLEIGAGTGLFARYFLDAFRGLCEEQKKDYYDRLRYVVSDRSARTVAQWMERGIFEPHRDHVVATAFDPTADASFASALTPVRAVICNYVLDVMPSTIVRAESGRTEELCVRTRLTDQSALLQQYTARSLDEIAALAASEDAADLAELVPLLSLLEVETDFRPLSEAPLPFLEDALTLAPERDKLVLNYGALAVLHRFMADVAADGFILVNDYGPVKQEEVASFCAPHRFGPTVAFGLDFVLLDRFCPRWGFAIAQPAGDERRGIHTRLVSRADLPGTRAVLERAFSAEAHDYFEGCVEQARAHAAAGRMHEALDAYRVAVSRSPRNWHLLGEAGEFLSLQLRSFDAALDLLQAAVALNPFYSSWLWNALGDALYCLNRHAHAHEAYLQAARIEPDDPRTNLNLAYTLESSGRVREALEAIARGLASDAREVFRQRLLDKQRQILTALSTRAQGEHERLLRRASRFQAS